MLTAIILDMTVNHKTKKHHEIYGTLAATHLNKI
nr:MAG TPA: hypothetical protein [Caudoviricetes sp.]DAT63212.1 MAG TPA: hypothetical protein [Caudoviricetes sp.]